jgi:hypothetical protein
MGLCLSPLRYGRNQFVPNPNPLRECLSASPIRQVKKPADTACLGHFYRNRVSVIPRSNPSENLKHESIADGERLNNPTGFLQNPSGIPEPFDLDGFAGVLRRSLAELDLSDGLSILDRRWQRS